MRSVYRPGFGRGLTVAIAVLCAAALVILLVNDSNRSAIAALPWLALLSGGVWATFWRPGVIVDDAGVQLVNVFRTITLPWPSINLIDTKWALTLTTAYGKYTAWAAPAPGGAGARNYHKSDFAGLPESTYAAQKSVRPGDNPRSASGAAALAVRRHWEELRDAGHLDRPRLEFSHAPVVWHWSTMAGAVILFGLGLLANASF